MNSCLELLGSKKYELVPFESIYTEPEILVKEDENVSKRLSSVAFDRIYKNAVLKLDASSSDVQRYLRASPFLRALSVPSFFPFFYLLLVAFIVDVALKNTRRSLRCAGT